MKRNLKQSRTSAVGILELTRSRQKDAGKREESHADSSCDNSHDKEELTHIDADNALVA